MKQMSIDCKSVRIGLALASGGARGSAHAGVLKVLEREDIRISAIAGSSIGAMVGGAYAARIPVERIEQERPENDRPLPGVYSVINQAVAIFQQEILRLKLTLWPADLLIRPVLPSTGVSYLRAADGIRAGEQATEEALPQLRALLAQGIQKPK